MTPRDWLSGREAWAQQRSQLMTWLQTADARRQYKRLQQQAPLVSAFETSEELLGYLRVEDDNQRDKKDAIYAELVRAARAADASAECSWTLLLLGLWPALDRTFNRLLRRSGDEPATEVMDAFTALVDRINLRTNPRIAAALTRGTRRDAFRARAREARRAKDWRPLEDDDGTARFPESLTTAPFDPFDEANDNLKELYRDLELAGGDDAELLLGADLYNVNLRELAARLGITHAAARKRKERARKRLEQRLGRRRPQSGCPSRRPGWRLPSKQVSGGAS